MKMEWKRKAIPKWFSTLSHTPKPHTDNLKTKQATLCMSSFLQSCVSLSDIEHAAESLKTDIILQMIGVKSITSDL